MKQVTMQELADAYGVRVAKDSDGQVFAFEGVPERTNWSWIDEDGRHACVTMLVSDADGHDWKNLVEPLDNIVIHDVRY